MPSTASDPLFHILSAQTWQRALDLGSYAPASLTAEGFVHLSYASQVERVANNLYRDQDGMVVVALDPARLSADVRDEDSYAAGELFPHLFGPVPTRAATAIHCLVRDDRGDYWCPGLG